MTPGAVTANAMCPVYSARWYEMFITEETARFPVLRASIALPKAQRRIHSAWWIAALRCAMAKLRVSANQPTAPRRTDGHRRNDPRKAVSLDGRSVI